MTKMLNNIITFESFDSLNESSYITVPEGINTTFNFTSNKNLTWDLENYGDKEHFQINSQTGEIRFDKVPDFEKPLDSKGTVVSLKLNSNTNSQFFIELFDYESPEFINTEITAENFLKYVDDNSYKNSFFHRAVNGFVLQGGGFYLYEDQEGGLYYDEIESKGTIKNEPGNSNTKGTIAMAKVGGDPNSATSQWFINLSDNSNNLDNQNGGFTVFGRILGSGMDAIEGLEIKGLNEIEYFNLGYYLMGSVFSNLPLWEKVSIDKVSSNDFIVIENIEALNENSLIESYKYNLRVKATDEFDNSLTHDLVISVKNIDESISAITGSVKENTTAVHTFTKDEDVTWSIAEGDDKDKFAIDGLTGALTFVEAPDYENPGSAANDNAYSLFLIATDDAGTETIQEVIVNVTNQYETEEPQQQEGAETEFDPDPQPTPELIEEITEPYQTVSASSDEISFYPGKDINLDLVYTTSDNESALTGLGLKVHYDSSVFNPSGDNNGVSALVDTFGNPTIIDDTDNLDNDENTDKYLAITWTDFMGNFPGGDLPATLASLSFASSESGVDSLTGESKDSKINFTSSSPAENYDFLGDSVTLKPQTFNLDVDGNGKVSALGDGLMVIRKLFGDAFAGDALTDKAISNDATRTTTEIHQFIQAGMDEKVLDVDGDGSVTALGDGLMVIRKLFGDAFAGDALTDKAISTDATRTTIEIHEYIAAISNLGTSV